MPAGRLLRALRPVGRPRRRIHSSYGGGRLHSSYTRAGKAVQPQARPDGTREEADTEPTPRDVDPATEEDPVPEPEPEPEPEPTPDTAEPARAEEAKDAAPESAGEGEGKKPQGESKDDEPGPMEVLYMREPTVVPGKHHPPMPYTHYFDTYLMVNRLTSAGFKKGGGVTTMKAVRALLGGKMEEAQGRLVSKGDVDNVSGLSRAPCSFIHGSCTRPARCRFIHFIPRESIHSLSYTCPVFIPHNHTKLQTIQTKPSKTPNKLPNKRGKG